MSKFCCFKYLLVCIVAVIVMNSTAEQLAASESNNTGKIKQASSVSQNSKRGVSNAVTPLRFTENLDYKKVLASQQEKTKTLQGKILVTEFFLYSCPHCFELEPLLQEWVQRNRDSIVFQRIPAVVTPNWVPLAKAFFVARELPKFEEINQALFKSIHDEKKVYLNEYQLAVFFEKYGLSRDEFIRRYNAQNVVEQVSEARRLSVRYAFRGVPAVVVNDQFKTAPFYVRDQATMIEVMDFLLDEVKSGKTTH